MGSGTISLPGVFLGSSSTHSLLISAAFLRTYLIYILWGMPMCIAASATVILPGMRKIGSGTISLPGVFLGNSSTHSLLISCAFLKTYLIYILWGMPMCIAASATVILPGMRKLAA
jgi:uncharacterized membrane protein